MNEEPQRTGAQTAGPRPNILNIVLVEPRIPQNSSAPGLTTGASLI